MLPQQYCLRWRYHHSNLQTMFSQLLEREAFCDVTLACDGKTIKAHKIVLSACSTYFETILSQYEEKDPILIMKDVKYIDIKCLVEFMYRGEINVDHCHLATLLKTAEELRIKGLAEVSWKDDDQTSSAKSNDFNGIQQAALPQVTTVLDENVESPCTNKKKRGRPPIDEYEPGYSSTPKIPNLDDNYSNDAMSSSEHELSIWEEEQTNTNESSPPPINTTEEPRIKVKKELQQPAESNDSFSDNLLSANEIKQEKQEIKQENSQRKNSGSSNVTTSSGQSFLTPAIEKEWPDVVKMNDYLSTRRRQQFWEEPFTKRVMDAIKTKNLEMKVAAELLGVSYGTLYGRYRDSYGCLKHPYRVRDFWTEQGPTDILLKLKRKEITLFRAAEQLNVTPQTLSNYLISMSQVDNNESGNQSNYSGMDYDELESEDENDLPDPPPTNNTNSFKNSVGYNSNNSTTATSNSVLANCPDITIIKKEKTDTSKVNNNSDHSDSNTDQIK